VKIFYDLGLNFLKASSVFVCILRHYITYCSIPAVEQGFTLPQEESVVGVHHVRFGLVGRLLVFIIVIVVIIVILVRLVEWLITFINKILKWNTLRCLIRNIYA